MNTVYELMHGDKKVAMIGKNGKCKIYDKVFMPFNLYLEEDTDIDTLVNNITNFQYWCASRILTLDRKHIKVILNSIGASQSFTDKDRANIALSYRCLSLTDIYWIRNQGEQVTFAEVNLYDNHLDNALVDISLKGKYISVNNKHLEKEMAKDLSTNGCYPKAWVRNRDQFYLYKNGGSNFVNNEVLASKVCQCFDCRQIKYHYDFYDNELVSVSEIITNKNYSIVSRESFDIYAINNDIDPIEYILDLDAHNFYMMNILDYLIGNTDRHWGNWGLMIDNEINQPMYLHPLMDFNLSFTAYDSVDGANCQTVMPIRMSQKDAAIEAVKHIGLNQICEIKKEWFVNRKADYDMLMKRLQILQILE